MKLGFVSMLNGLSFFLIYFILCTRWKTTTKVSMLNVLSFFLIIEREVRTLEFELKVSMLNVLSFFLIYRQGTSWKFEIRFDAQCFELFLNAEIKRFSNPFDWEGFDAQCFELFLNFGKTIWPNGRMFRCSMFWAFS